MAACLCVRQHFQALPAPCACPTFASILSLVIGPPLCAPASFLPYCSKPIVQRWKYLYEEGFGGATRPRCMSGVTKKDLAGESLRAEFAELCKMM